MCSELPLVILNGFNGPVELLPQRLGEEFFDGHIKLLAENDSQAGVDVVL